MLNFNLTDEEFNALAEKYKTSDNFFNHFEFCDTINQAFTTKGIDKNPKAQVK